MMVTWLALALGCADDKASGHGQADTGMREDGPADDSDVPPEGDTDTPCAPVGTADCPIPIAAVPFVDSRDTTAAPSDGVDRYACAPDTDESGPEFFYAITVDTRSILSVRVDSAAGADIDVHILADSDPESCVSRHHLGTGWVVGAGTWILTADTWVDADGVELAGAYTLTVDLLPLTGGPCAMVDFDLRMYWPACGLGIDCHVETGTDGVDTPVVHTPSVGPVVKEAHLVTTDEDFPHGWPQAIDDQIDRHYAISEAETGYVMDRTEPWAPQEGSEYGQGASGAPLPVDAEAFYANMYWRDRPPAGERMIVINPFDGRAVVAAGGFETGPGANIALGGVTEEVHHHLGTAHRDPMVLGFAADQSLPYGPIDCAW